MYLLTVVILICFVYYLWVSHLFFGERDVFPVAFQNSYNNISKCVGWHESAREKVVGSMKGELQSCFDNNKEILLSIARETFSPLAQEQYELFVHTLLKLINEKVIYTNLQFLL